MEIVNDLSLAKIVTLKPAAAAIFEKHHLDFCCKGKQTLAEAVTDKTLLDRVNSELSNIFNEEEKQTINYEQISLTELIGVILSKHHTYVKEILPVLYAHTQKIAGKHGERHPELMRIAAIFAEIKLDFEQHLMKEEEILFPLIMELEEMHNSKMDRKFLEAIAAPIEMMMFEHENAGRMTHEIMELTNNYTPPADACMTYMVTFKELQQFELDLHQHVHLENNILFQRAMALYQA